MQSSTRETLVKLRTLRFLGTYENVIFILVQFKCVTQKEEKVTRDPQFNTFALYISQIIYSHPAGRASIFDCLTDGVNQFWFEYTIMFYEK